MAGILIAVLFSALAFIVSIALGLPSAVALVAALLVLAAGIPSRGYGLGRRW